MNIWKLVAASVVACAASLPAHAQEVPAPTPIVTDRPDYLALEKESKTNSSPLLEKKLRGVRPYTKRLPKYWPELDVTERQMKLAYAIQKDYHERIAMLEARIARLERERDAKLNFILSDTQRFKYEKLSADAKKEHDAKMKARAEARAAEKERDANDEE